MKKSPWFILLPALACFLICPASRAQEAPPPKKLHGKALKEKMASIQIIQGTPEAPYQKLAPLWSSKSDMPKTLKDLRKQAAKMGADAVIDLRVRTQKLESTSYDPGWWGPGWGGGFGPYGGPWGGYWGGMGYWGGYVRSHSYTQPVVTGWAIKWKGAPPQEVKDRPAKETLEQAVEDAPQN